MDRLLGFACSGLVEAVGFHVRSDELKIFLSFSFFFGFWSRLGREFRVSISSGEYPTFLVLHIHAWGAIQPCWKIRRDLHGLTLEKEKEGHTTLYRV